MRPVAVRASLPDAGGTGIVDTFRHLFQQEPDRNLFVWREKGKTHELTRAQFRKAVLALSDELRDRGFAPGTRVALISESRPEWVIAFLATLSAGLVVVPLDVKLTLMEMHTLLKHADPSHLFISRECAAQFNVTALARISHQK